MPDTRENGRHSVLRALLAGAVVVGGLLAGIHFRRVLRAAHDPGFSVAPAHATIAIRSRDGARPIVSASGEFITLEPGGKFLNNSTTNKPVFITGDSAWSLI